MRDPRPDRDVAVEVLPPEGADESRHKARFSNEARTVAALSHPDIFGTPEK